MVAGETWLDVPVTPAAGRAGAEEVLMRLFIAAILAGAVAGCSSPTAQQTPAPKSADNPVSSLPDGWRARLDDPEAKDTGGVQVEKDAIVFTGGPGGLYYKPGMKAEKDYTVIAAFTQAKILPAPQPYGLFISGVDLDKDTISYTGFLVRQDGKYRIVTRSGAKETVVVDWRTASPMLEPKGVKPTNTLEIRALQDGVHFLIAGKEVHQMPRSAAGADGVAGVRVGPGLTIQVTKLETEKFP
jgi:hypothetical protein